MTGYVLLSQAPHRLVRVYHHLAGHVIFDAFGQGGQSVFELTAHELRTFLASVSPELLEEALAKQEHKES